jgi:glycosyltransferase involved in cell wall biosynthesis
VHAIVGSDGPLLPALSDAGARAILLPMPAALASFGDSAMIGPGLGRSPARMLSRGSWAAFDAWRYASKLRRVLRELKPDIVHSDGNKFHLLSRIACGRNRPVVWHLHDFLGERPGMRRLIRLAAGKRTSAIAVSQAVAQDARDLLESTPIAVIPNAVNTEQFVPGPGDGHFLDRLAGLEPVDNILRIGLVATYARWKGQDLFLEAAARMPSELPIRYFIIGGPIYQTAGSQFSEQELRGRIARLSLDNHAYLLGFQNDMPAIYRALDVVVHASTRPEPFGLTIIEGMACGRPVIVSAGGGAIELFQHQKDAIGVRPGDCGQLAAAMARLAADPDLRHRLGRAARQTAITRFDRKRFERQLIAMYRSLIRD